LINQSRLFFISGWLLLLAGCATVPKQSPVPATPGAIPQEAVPQGGLPQGSLPPGAVPPQTPGGVIVEQVPKATMSGNPAVIALLDRAQIDTDTGHREAAGASLERGLRIEPRNAWLWYELAQLRLVQGQYAQAIALAQKSISFAAHDRRLLALDWRVIGNARVAQGNSAGAEEAFKQAADLEAAVKAEADHGF
jgi:tetratricopeptide (TPR) repeat protein